MHVKILYRKALYVFLSCWLVLFTATPSFAVYDPNPKHSKWFHDSIVNDPTVKSTVEVKAQKTYPVSTLDQNGKPIKQIRKAKATVKVAANVNRIGKTIFKRNPVGAIATAVTAILGRSVDWLLDPENNAVKYKMQDVTSCKNQEFLWRSSVTKKDYCVPESACDYLTFANNGEGIPGYSFSHLDGKSCFYNDKNFSTITRVSNPDYDPDYVDSDFGYIPIGQVAQQMIDHANDGDAESMQVMADAAADALEAGELDSALDAASDIPQPDPEEITQEQYDNPDYPAPDTPTDPDGDTGGETPNPDPEPDPTPTEWPAFCDWATLACDYYNWAMEAWEPPANENTEVDIQQPDIGDWQSKANASYVQFNGQCPADVTIPINYMGASTDLSISYQPFCHFASMIKPAVILGAWISAMLIISGGRAKES